MKMYNLHTFSEYELAQLLCRLVLACPIIIRHLPIDLQNLVRSHYPFLFNPKQTNSQNKSHNRDLNKFKRPRSSEIKICKYSITYREQRYSIQDLLEELTGIRIDDMESMRISIVSHDQLSGIYPGLTLDYFFERSCEIEENMS